MKPYTLVFNAGSATLKFALFRGARAQTMVSFGSVERIGLAKSFFSANGKIVATRFVPDHASAARSVIAFLRVPAAELRLIGHRVVHGGERFTQPTRITSAVIARLDRLSKLAPLHNPLSLAVIRACRRSFPAVLNAAVFDTAYFAGFTPEQFLYAVPYDWYRRYGIRRYGFHGISHQFAAKEAAQELQLPIGSLNAITVHLGNGSSMTAVRRGKPVATSLGFTPLEGLVMGTRSGSIDPAIPLYLQQQLHWSTDRVYRTLNTESGLLGITGFTSDMREVLRAAGLPVTGYHGRVRFTAGQRVRARLAVALYVSRVRQVLMGYTSLVPRPQAVVFTGGVGERSAIIRKKIMSGLPFRNRPRVLVVPSDEAAAIAHILSTRVY